MSISNKGRILLNSKRLILLREEMGYSQETFANKCQSKGIRLSIATIKRAEAGNKVLCRTALEFAKFYDVDFSELRDDQ